MHFNCTLIHKTEHLTVSTWTRCKKKKNTHKLNQMHNASQSKNKQQHQNKKRINRSVFFVVTRFFSATAAAAAAAVVVLCSWVRFCSMFDLLNSCSVLRLSLLRPLKRFGCTYELLRRWWWIMDSIFLSLWLFSAHRPSVRPSVCASVVPALYRSNGIFNWAFESVHIYIVFFAFCFLFRQFFVCSAVYLIVRSVGRSCCALPPRSYHNGKLIYNNNYSALMCNAKCVIVMNAHCILRV